MAIKLTQRQEGFALAVARDGVTQAEAYRRNYTCEGWPAKRVSKQASALAGNSKVAAKINQLLADKQAVANTEFDITVKMLLQKYIEIAFTDPNELISVRSGACRHCWGIGGGYHWKEREYCEALVNWEALSLVKPGNPPAPMPDIAGGFGYRFTADPNPECHECEGEGVERVVPRDTTKLSAGAKHLYRGAQRTKDGLKILFADQDKALDSIGRMLGAFDDRLRVDLRGAVASLQLSTADPVEAAREYEKMLAGVSN